MLSVERQGVPAQGLGCFQPQVLRGGAVFHQFDHGIDGAAQAGVALGADGRGTVLGIGFRTGDVCQLPLGAFRTALQAGQQVVKIGRFRPDAVPVVP